MSVIYKGTDWTIYTRDDSKKLHLYFKLKGIEKPIRKSLSTSNLKLGLELADKLYAEALIDVYDLKKEPTIKDGIDLFLRKSEAKKKSYRDDLAKVERIYEFFGSDILMSKILPINIEEFMKKITNTVSEKTNRPLTPATANLYYRFLKSVYNNAQKNDLFEGKNPCSNVSQFKESKLLEYFDKDLAKDILEYCKEISSSTNSQKNIVQYYFYLYAFLLSKTGARGGEILRLKWSDITPTLFNFNKDSKSGKARIMLVLSGVLETLEPYKRYAGPNDFVVPIGYKNPSQFNRHWNKVRKKFNLTKNHRMHTFRHTVATWLIDEGIPLPIVSHLLGHLDQSTTYHYIHSNIVSHREKIDNAMKIL